MRKIILSIATIVALAFSGTGLQAAATTKYWRLAAAPSGSAGSATPTGNWDVATLNWDTVAGGTGSHVAFVAGDNAVFSAAGDATGAWTVTLGSSLAAGFVTIEEGTVTKSGATLTTQTITVNSGATLSYNSSGGIAASAGGTCTLNGGTLGYTSGGAGGTFLTANMGIVLNGGGALSDAVGTPNIYSGVISGTGDLTKVGAGILAITTTCTYSGNTIVNNGTLRLRTGSPQIPNTALTVTSPGGFDPAAFSQTVASLTGSGGIPFSGAGTLTISGSSSTVHSGVISGGGIITRAGTGSTTLRGVNTLTGQFIISAGTVTVALGASLCGSAADLQMSGGTLSLTNVSQSVEDFGGSGGTVILNSGVTLNTLGTFVSAARTTNYAGLLTGPGNLNVAAGIQALSGANDYTGTTTVGSGALLKVQNSSALGGSAAGQGTSVTAGGAVQISSTVNSPEPLVLNGTGINNDGALRQTNNTPNIWSGGITLGSSGVRINGDASTLTVMGGISGAGNALTIGGAGSVVITNNPGNQINIGSAALTKDGNGTLTLITSNIYGATAMSAGRINVQASDCLGQGTVTISPTNGIIIANNGTVDVTITNNFTLNSSAFNVDISANSGRQLFLNGKISGAAAGWKKDNSGSTGTLILNNSANDFSGILTNFAGIIIAGANNALGTTAGKTIINSGATLGFQNGINYSTAEPVTISGTGRLGLGAIANIQADNNTFAGPITLAADSTVGAAAGGTLTLSGGINGGFALTKTNSGTVILAGSNGYTGNTTNLLGTLALSGAGNILSTNISINSGATLDVSGLSGSTYTLASGQTLKGNGGINGTIVVASGATVAPGASIGILYFTNTPTLSGTTAMELNKAAGPVLTSDKLVVVTGGGTLAYGGTLAISASGLALTNTDTFDLFDADTFSGSFVSVTPAAPGTGLLWNTNQLPVNGTISVICNGTLAATASPNTNTCSGVGVLLGASASAGSGTGYTYSWSPATGLSSTSIANPIASPTVTTTYTVTATDSAGCTAQASVTVSTDQSPAITAQPANTTVCGGTTASFSVSATGSGLAYSWAKHDNGGWGNAWSASGSGGTFRATSTGDNFGDAACTGLSPANDINSPSGNALGMYGGGSGDEVVTRTFTALAAGQAVSIDFDNGNVDGGNKVGFSLQTSGGADVLQFYFVGGTATYKYNDGSESDTGIGFQRTGLRVQFVLTSASAYKLIVNACGSSSSNVFTGTYSGTIAKLALFNQNTSGGADYDIYFNNFLVGGYTDNADNYSGAWGGEDKGDQPIIGGNGGSTYTTPTLTTADSGTQYEVVVSGCGGSILSSAASVTVNPPALVNAGPDQTSCASSPAVTLGGWFGGAALGATWSGGAGTFNPDNTTTNAIYTPSSGEINAGTVTLTLTAADPDGAGPCGPANDSVVITIKPVAVVDAGPDKAVCASSPATTLGGYFGGGASSATWTGGAGSFNPNNTTTNAIYTPSAGEILAGTVTLTLTTDDPAGPCGSANDAMVITINPVATVNAGPDQTVCGDAPDTTLAGSIGGSAASATWSGGAGSFNPNNTTLSAIYTPSAGEIAAGTVTLTLTTDDPSGPCGPVNDSMVITFDKVVATNVTFVRSAGSSLKISKTNLVANASDTDSEAITFVGAGTDGVNLLTTNGVTLTTDANWIFYTNSVTPDAPDSFTYKVTDARGCIGLGTVTIQVITNATGQGTTVVVSGSTVTVGFAGIPGRSYEVQRSTNLTDWAILGSTTAPPQGVFEWVDDFNDLGVPPADPPASAYYRLRLP